MHAYGLSVQGVVRGFLDGKACIQYDDGDTEDLGR
jgi:hypothetical protein